MKIGDKVRIKTTEKLKAVGFGNDWDNYVKELFKKQGKSLCASAEIRRAFPLLISLCRRFFIVQ